MIINLLTENDSAVIARVAELYDESREIFDGDRLVGTAYFPIGDELPLFIALDNELATTAESNGYNVIVLGSPVEANVTVTPDWLDSTGDLLEELLGL